MHFPGGVLCGQGAEHVIAGVVSADYPGALLGAWPALDLLRGGLGVLRVDEYRLVTSYRDEYRDYCGMGFHDRAI